MPGKHVRFASTNTLHGQGTPALTVSSFSPASSSRSAVLTPPSSTAFLPGPMPFPSPISASFSKPSSKSTYIHPLLQPSSHPAFDYDIRSSPSRIVSRSRSVSTRSLSEPATQPPVRTLTITSSYLPWTITVRPSANGSYITLGDVFNDVYLSLQTQISAQDFQRLPRENDRRRVTEAYTTRYRNFASSRDYEAEKRAGVRRVDFLAGQTRFIGLSSSPHTHGVFVLVTD